MSHKDLIEDPFNGHNSMSLQGGAVEGSLEIQVIRADGTKEDPYIAAYYHRNPWKQAKWESDTFGKLTPETEERIRESVRKQAPKVGAAVLALSTIAYLVIKNK